MANINLEAARRAAEAINQVAELFWMNYPARTQVGEMPVGKETIDIVYTPGIWGLATHHPAFVYTDAQGRRWVAQAYPGPGREFKSEVVPLDENAFDYQQIMKSLEQGHFRRALTGDSLVSKFEVLRAVADDMDETIFEYGFNWPRVLGSDGIAGISWVDVDGTFAGVAAKALGVELWPDLPAPHFLNTWTQTPYGYGTPMPTTNGELLDPANEWIIEAERTPQGSRTDLQRQLLAQRDELRGESDIFPVNPNGSIFVPPDQRKRQAQEQAYLRTQEGATDPVIETLVETGGEPPEAWPPASRFSVTGPVPAPPVSPLGDRLQQLEEQNAPRPLGMLPEPPADIQSAISYSPVSFSPTPIEDIVGRNRSGGSIDRAREALMPPAPTGQTPLNVAFAMRDRRNPSLSQQFALQQFQSSAGNGGGGSMPGSVLVQPGQTFEGIANEYGLSVEQLQARNQHIRSTENLHTGVTVNLR